MDETKAALTSASSLIYQPPSYVERLDLERVFPVSRPVEVELGAGDGTFIVRWAQQHPERNFIAVERLLGRLRKIDRRGRRSGLDNLRALRIEAGYFIEFMLPAGAAHALHVYFPDPWPKKKHHRRRLINRTFVDLASRALAPGGAIYLRTDNGDYFAQMTEVFGDSPRFKAVSTPSALSAVMTDFEREFNTQGLATLRAAFQLR